MNYIDELRDVIKRLHGVDSMHVESIPIKEEFKGSTVCEGIVEVLSETGLRMNALTYSIEFRHPSLLTESNTRALSPTFSFLPFSSYVSFDIFVDTGTRTCKLNLFSEPQTTCEDSPSANCVR
jgi:hypothetical protein